ncbi:HNH endonuclease signature motif containing protein [Vibrio sp. EJY3]|uniref:HNH endonuclease signature motif containing protein n=1 Tax=Vibrio sp. (strain EJY3) TaxID=1116375 RepID=UPI0011D19AC0|nr:HNH endonuclease signature motif containing protein [Vibrio sp. EJY3]
MYYSEEMKAFMAEHYANAPIKDWLDEFNNKFNCSVNKKTMYGSLKRYQFKAGRTGYFVKGQQPHNKGKPMPARGKSIETQFGGVRSNKKDDEKPLGSTRVDVKDGYLLVKVRMGTNAYELAHRVLWESVHGKIPDGHVIRFYDNSPEKIKSPTIENLFIVGRAVHARLNKMDWKNTPLSIRETKVLIARLEQEILDKQGLQA